jgi:hypothetical protein
MRDDQGHLANLIPGVNQGEVLFASPLAHAFWRQKRGPKVEF